MREVGRWLAPALATIGFPPMTSVPQFRWAWLHACGHPTTTVNQSMMKMLPKHQQYSPSPSQPPFTPAWAPVAPHPRRLPPPGTGSSSWHPQRPHLSTTLFIFMSLRVSRVSISCKAGCGIFQLAKLIHYFEYRSFPLNGVPGGAAPPRNPEDFLCLTAPHRRKAKNSTTCLVLLH